MAHGCPVGLAKVARDHVHAFGIDWEDDSGTNSAAFAPFAWHVA